MSVKNPRCGIYTITTPNGSVYVGSSKRIENRWSGHRCALRKGTHHSRRLQDAWLKYGDALVFEVIEECDCSLLNDREQAHIDRLRPVLNTSMFVANVWLNPETRAKLAAVHSSPEWKAARSKIASRPRPEWIAVDCSDGTSYPNMTEAGRAYGVSASAIFALVKTQRIGGAAGVRFKLATDEWRDVITSGEQRVLSRRLGGTKFSPESRAQMSESAKRRGTRQRNTFGRFA